MTWKPERLERRYATIRRKSRANEVVLMGLERDLPYFEQNAKDDPELELLIVAKTRSTRISSKQAAKLKAELMRDSWRPQFFAPEETKRKPFPYTPNELRSSEEKYDLKRCTPKVVRRAELPKEPATGPQKGEKPTKYPPVITFQILESGEVVNARVTRSSGFQFIDQHALKSIEGVQYNSRPGCGVVESEATVNVDF